MNTEKILAGVRLLFRLWWPASVFIAMCTGLLLIFQQILFLIDHYKNFSLIGVAWLVLFIVYVILGVVFIRLFARHIRGLLEPLERRMRSLMIFLSGGPFYALCLLCIFSGIVAILDPNAGGGAVFFGLAGSVFFAMVSVAYLLLLHLFLRRPAAVA
ncbi:hypothetical protein [Dictyobacter alpinus]|nr:hypothetical protein [Dictyobacter alpinus]